MFKKVILPLIIFIPLVLLQILVMKSIFAASSEKWSSEFEAITTFQNRIRDHQESLKQYTKIIQQRPNDPVAYYNRAMVHSALGMHDQALSDYNKAILLRPNALQPYIGKLGALYASGKHQEMLDVANHVLTHFKDHAWGYYWRGKASLAIGKPQKAIGDFKKFLEKEDNPERVADICYSLGSAFFEQGEFNEAINYLNMAIVKNPLNFENLVLRGLIYKGKLEYELALSDLKRGFQLSKNRSSLACNSIAWILATCPNPDFRNGAEAVTMAKKAIELDGSKPYYHDTLAAAYAESGMIEKAINEQKNAIKLLGKVPDIERTEIYSLYQKRLNSYMNGKPFRDMEE